MATDQTRLPINIAALSTQNETLIRVLSHDDDRFNDAMHGDDIKHIVTSGDYPTMFRDVAYPDFLVVWDHGDGPHNPTAYESRLLDGAGWKDLRVYPEWVWEMARAILHERGLDDSYVVLWFVGDDR